MKKFLEKMSSSNVHAVVMIAKDALGSGKIREGVEKLATLSAIPATANTARAILSLEGGEVEVNPGDKVAIVHPDDTITEAVVTEAGGLQDTGEVVDLDKEGVEIPAPAAEEVAAEEVAAEEVAAEEVAAEEVVAEEVAAEEAPAAEKSGKGSKRKK